MESAELKNQRLKEVFQKKIQEFRTACYVLTGYQMDITVENQYRLTSVYAEHMEDSLLFKVNSYANVFDYMTHAVYRNVFTFGHDVMKCMGYVLTN